MSTTRGRRVSIACLLVLSCTARCVHADWIEIQGSATGTWLLLETDPSSVGATTDFTLRVDPTALTDPRLETDGSGTFRIAAGGFEFCYASPQLGAGCHTTWNGVETDPSAIETYQYAHLTFLDIGESRWQLRFDAIVPGCDCVDIPAAEAVEGDPCTRVALSVLLLSRPGRDLLPVVAGWEAYLGDLDVEAVDLNMDRDAVWIAPYRGGDAVTPLWSFEGTLTILTSETVDATTSTFGRIKAPYGPALR